MLLPFPVLVKSRIQRRKKLVLLGLFGLGLFITVIQIVRIQTVHQLANYVDSAPLILWSAVENNLGIVVANVPTLAPLVKYYSERATRTGRGTGSGTAGLGAGGRPSGYALENGSSRYTAATWRSRRSAAARSKMFELGSVHDGHDDDAVVAAAAAAAVAGAELDSFDGVVGKGGNNNTSTESILESKNDNNINYHGHEGRAPAAGITKKVEVTITRA